MIEKELHTRYQRQIMLKGFGVPAQQKLLAASVLVIGAGGLGCPVLQYLCAAGIGTVGIIDDDVVALSNLHRQVLFTTEHVGKSKVLIAAERLKQMNPDVQIEVYNERLAVDNALTIIKKYDIIVDGTDNFATRYLVNDACVLLGKPLVYGAISQYEGQLAVFNWKRGEGNERAVNYRDIFSQAPSDADVPNCSEAGVLGVLPGIIGTMMATEVIKMVAGIGEVQSGALITYNVLNNQSYRIEVTPCKEAESALPATEAAFLRTIYEERCANNRDIEISNDEFTKWMGSENVLFVDVRNPGEMPVVTAFQHINIPVDEIEGRSDELKQENIILFCLSGKRSLSAARKLKALTKGVNVYSLKGGLKSRYVHSE